MTTQVATRSFTYVDQFGRRQEIKAGVTYVGPESECYQRFRDSFKLASRAMPAIEDRPCRQPVHLIPRDRARATPQRSNHVVRSEPPLEPPSEVRMSFAIRRALQHEAAEASSDGLESGGFLFGRIEPDIFGIGTRVEILDLSHAWRASEKRAAGSMRWSPEHMADVVSGKESKWPLIGDWHTRLTWAAGVERLTASAGRPAVPPAISVS
jgi:hypothetical protein